MDRGEVDEAERWIGAAETGLGPGRDHDAHSLESDTAVLRAVHGFKIGNVPQAHDAARRVIELEPDGASFARTVAHCILGITEYWSGRSAGASDALDRAVQLARETANDLAASYALGYLALIRVEEGDPTEGERLALDATGMSDAAGFTEHFVTMMGHLSRGLALECLGNLDEAERSVTRSVTLARRGAAAIEMASSLLAHADLLSARGERDGAKAALREAKELVARCPEPGILVERLRKTERRPNLALPRISRPAGVGAAALTERELVVLRLLPSPLSRREIGDALFVSQNTVKTHTKGIYRKLDASTRHVTSRDELGMRPASM